VETLIHYPIPCHLQEAFAHLGYVRGDFPVAEQIAAEALSLPLWPGMPLESVDQVAAGICAA
jgi:dTDP-4-amino-4,6-dideoxygalactose transaminase